MDNQHKKIKGYRDLTQQEIDLMNRVKDMAEKVQELVEEMAHMTGEPSDTAPDGTTTPNHRWLAIGRTDLQTGFMALVRSIAKPTSF